MEREREEERERHSQAGRIMTYGVYYNREGSCHHALNFQDAINVKPSWLWLGNNYATIDALYQCFFSHS